MEEPIKIVEILLNEASRNVEKKKEVYLNELKTAIDVGVYNSNTVLNLANYLSRLAMDMSKFEGEEEKLKELLSYLKINCK